MLRASILATLLAVILAASTRAEDDLRRTPVVRAVERARPAVVNIATQRLVAPRVPFLVDIFDEDYRRWFLENHGGEARLQTTSLGSGLLVDPDGYILTNEHVVRRADQILVGIWGREEPLTARLVASDPTSDLALLRVEAGAPLPYLELGSSQDLMIGEPAIAIGNPFGLGQTVSVGVVSAVNRPVVIGGNIVYHDFLQTDASINPGNSGGPLLNIHGQVIGINTAVRAYAEGIGFALPADRARQALIRLSDPRWLRGFTVGLEMADGRRGVEVTQVLPGGPAAGSGIQVGDRVVDVDGQPVASVLALHKALLAHARGETVTLTVRPVEPLMDRDARAVPIELVWHPRNQAEDMVARRMGLHASTVAGSDTGEGAGPGPGILVEEIVPDGPSSDVGFQAGDLLVAVGLGQDTYRIQSTDSLASLLERLPERTRLGVHVSREGRLFSGEVILH